MPNICKISGSLSFNENTRACGFILRSSTDSETGYYVKIEPQRNRLILDSWPRKKSAPFPYVSINPFMAELELFKIEKRLKAQLDNGTITQEEYNHLLREETRKYELEKLEREKYK